MDMLKNKIKFASLSIFFIAGIALSGTVLGQTPEEDDDSCQYYYCETTTGKCKLNQNGTTCESPTGELPCTVSGVCD